MASSYKIIDIQQVGTNLWNVTLEITTANNVYANQVYQWSIVSGDTTTLTTKCNDIVAYFDAQEAAVPAALPAAFAALFPAPVVP